MLLHRKYFSLEELVQYWRDNHNKNAEAIDFVHAALRGEFNLYIAPSFMERRLSGIEFVKEIVQDTIHSYSSCSMNKEIDETVDSLLDGKVRLVPLNEGGYPDAVAPYDGGPGVYRIVDLNLLLDDMTTKDGRRSDVFSIAQGSDEFAPLIVTAKDHQPLLSYSCDYRDIFLLGEEIAPIENSLFKETGQLSGQDEKISSKSLFLLIAILKKKLMDETSTAKQSSLIDELVREYGDLKGVSKSNLEAIFAEANREEKKRL